MAGYEKLLSLANLLWLYIALLERYVCIRKPAGIYLGGFPMKDYTSSSKGHLEATIL